MGPRYSRLYLNEYAALRGLRVYGVKRVLDKAGKEAIMAVIKDMMKKDLEEQWKKGLPDKRILDINKYSY